MKVVIHDIEGQEGQQTVITVKSGGSETLAPLFCDWEEVVDNKLQIGGTYELQWYPIKVEAAPAQTTEAPTDVKAGPADEEDVD